MRGPAPIQNGSNVISIEAEMYKKQQILKAVGLAGERL
jgi:hypothetical protein